MKKNSYTLCVILLLKYKNRDTLKIITFFYFYHLNQSMEHNKLIRTYSQTFYPTDITFLLLLYRCAHRKSLFLINHWSIDVSLIRFNKPTYANIILLLLVNKLAAISRTQKVPQLINKLIYDCIILKTFVF